MAKGEVAGGLIGYDPHVYQYELSEEAARAQADYSPPVFVARAMNAFGSWFIDFRKVVDAFQRRRRAQLEGSSSVPLLRHRWFFRTGYRRLLTTACMPALDGVESKLRDWARVADVGAVTGPRSW